MELSLVLSFRQGVELRVRVPQIQESLPAQEAVAKHYKHGLLFLICLFTFHKIVCFVLMRDSF